MGCQLVETVFESSFGFTYVLFRAVVALYHENDDFGVRPCLHGVGDPGLVGQVSFVLCPPERENKRN